MKKYAYIILCFVMIGILSACGKDDEAKVKVTEENRAYLEEYNKSLQGTIEDMNSILGVYNNGLDGIYTQEYSNEQFAKVLKEQIKESNALIKSVESLNVKPELFQVHQQLLALVNRSHQLLLNTIDEANNPDQEIEKDPFRVEFLAIKQEQAVIANDWKVLAQQLVAAGENPEE
ncbi:hypothetical protein [Cytobacillus oceanisediminis]|uniref:Lipoprotein n=1 Tax=Cytobacillus oceanisediminis TaxID=665099 RepID=A0ABX3CNJ5_9BACI|nr:hypothetical protein [Cytobacillus oceanisediminis]OHX44806.1 hypothetical protein BBV17_25225 [Cytobacillus oceanisediminis]